MLQAVELLEGARLLVADKIGSSSLLAERPGKPMAKHKSRALSSTLSQRCPLIACLLFTCHKDAPVSTSTPLLMRSNLDHEPQLR